MEENKEPKIEPIEANKLGHPKSTEKQQQYPKKIIGSYDEMTDLIDLKRQLSEIIAAWDDIPRSASDLGSISSPASSYVSLASTPRETDSSASLLPRHPYEEEIQQSPRSPTSEVIVNASSNLNLSKSAYQSSLLKQRAGHGLDTFVLNPLIVCLRELDFLLSKMPEQESGDIEYPDSRPTDDSQKLYKGIVTNLRKLITINGKPDYKKRQAYLIKILLDTVHCQIKLFEHQYKKEIARQKTIENKYSANLQRLEAIKRKHTNLNDSFNALYKKLCAFRSKILQDDPTGKCIRWKAQYKADPFLEIYEQELAKIQERLDKALKDLDSLAETSEFLSIKNCYDSVQATIHDHTLGPRGKLAKIYVYAKKAEHIIKDQCKKLLSQQIDSASTKKNKENFLSAQNNLGEIRLPIKCKDFSVGSPVKAQPSPSAPRLVPVDAVQSEREIASLVEKPKPVITGKVAIAAATSKELDKYDYKTNGIGGLFIRGSSEPRLEMAKKFRVQALQLVDNIEDKAGISQFISTLRAEQKKLEALNSQRHPFISILAFILPNFILSKEIRLLTTIKKINNKIKKLAETDVDLQQAIENAEAPQSVAEVFHTPVVT